MKKTIFFILITISTTLSFSQIISTYNGKALSIILDSYNCTTRAKFKLPDTTYVWIFSIPATDLDTVLGDSVAVFWTDCGTGCLGYYFFFFKPKFFVQYYSDCYVVSYDNLLVARKDVCDTKLQVVEARTRRIIFYRTILRPDVCQIYYPGFYPFEKIEFSGNYLIFKPDKESLKAFKPQYRQSKTFAFRLAH